MHSLDDDAHSSSNNYSYNLAYFYARNKIFSKWMAHKKCIIPRSLTRDLHDSQEKVMPLKNRFHTAVTNTNVGIN